MEELEKDTPSEVILPKFRGLYRYVKIPVKALDWIIGICIAVIVIVVVFEMVNPGLKVTFDSNGGTDVPVQKQMYGELLEEPEDPVREGYTFTGWYKDPACDDLWDVETDTIESDTNLYAGWQKNE